MIRITSSGSFDNMEKFLKRCKSKAFFQNLGSYAQEGVDALQSATPVRTGKTAGSWSYQINVGAGNVQIDWINDNENEGRNIVTLIVYGHGLHQGGYVAGNNFINPVIEPVFDKIADEVWKEVCK